MSGPLVFAPQPIPPTENAFDDEVAARIAGDTAEAAARTLGDTTEAATRTTAINAEAAARIAGDLTNRYFFLPQAYGAVGDGSHDDTSYVQAAVTAAVAAAGWVLLTAAYKITAPITVAGPIVISGDGSSTGASIIPATPNQIAFDITTQLPVNFERFTIQPSTTGTVGFRVNPTPGNTESTWRDLHINGCDIGINTQNASVWTIDNCRFENFTTAGVIVRCTSNPDAGDSAISNCFFLPAGSTESGVQQQSGGGLRITNTKFLNGRYGYVLTLDGGVGVITGQLMISNCSFDGPQTGIQLGQAGALSQFHDVTITGNIFNVNTFGIITANNFGNDGWLVNLAISGNTFYLASPGTGIALQGTNGFTIGDCNFYSPSSGGTCVTVDAHCSQGVINPCNRWGAGITTYVQNLGAQVKVMPKVQHGTGSVTTTTGSGAVFVGSAGAATVFSPAFLGALPQVVITPNDSAGNIAANAVGISLTQFTARVVGIANGTVVPFNWTAYGDW